MRPCNSISNTTLWRILLMSLFAIPVVYTIVYAMEGGCVDRFMYPKIGTPRFEIEFRGVAVWLLHMGLLLFWVRCSNCTSYILNSHTFRIFLKSWIIFWNTKIFFRSLGISLIWNLYCLIICLPQKMVSTRVILTLKISVALDH